MYNKTPNLYDQIRDEITRVSQELKKDTSRGDTTAMCEASLRGTSNALTYMAETPANGYIRQEVLTALMTASNYAGRALAKATCQREEGLASTVAKISLNAAHLYALDALVAR